MGPFSVFYFSKRIRYSSFNLSCKKCCQLAINLHNHKTHQCFLAGNCLILLIGAKAPADSLKPLGTVPNEDDILTQRQTQFVHFSAASFVTGFAFDSRVWRLCLTSSWSLQTGALTFCINPALCSQWGENRSIHLINPCVWGREIRKYTLNNLLYEVKTSKLLLNVTPPYMTISWPSSAEDTNETGPSSFLSIGLLTRKFWSHLSINADWPFDYLYRMLIQNKPGLISTCRPLECPQCRWR